MAKKVEKNEESITFKLNGAARSKEKRVGVWQELLFKWLFMIGIYKKPLGQGVYKIFETTLSTCPLFGCCLPIYQNEMGLNILPRNWWFLFCYAVVLRLSDSKRGLLEAAGANRIIGWGPKYHMFLHCCKLFRTVQILTRCLVEFYWKCCDQALVEIVFKTEFLELSDSPYIQSKISVLD